VKQAAPHPLRDATNRIKPMSFPRRHLTDCSTTVKESSLLFFRLLSVATDGKDFPHLRTGKTVPTDNGTCTSFQPLEHPDTGLGFQQKHFELILNHPPKFGQVYGPIKKRRRQKTSEETPQRGMIFIPGSQPSDDL
jgi:hypothetical protein